MKLKRTMAFILASAMSLTMLPSVTCADESTSETYSFVVLTDLHYITEPAEEDRENVEKCARTEVRLMAETEKIVGQALNDAMAISPDGMLLCGDLTSNGEKEYAEALAGKLAEISPELPNGIFLTNGNHDINNSYAASFKNGVISEGERITPADFKEIFADYGYGENSRYFGELSYATEIADGITLIVMDTNIYSDDTTARYNDAQITGGTMPEDVLEWAADEAKAANAKGNLVIGMCHHGIMPHFSVGGDIVTAYQNEYVVTNWKEVSETLADAGVAAVLTGHAHSNDISSYTSKNGNIIYDISTASVPVYPMAWRSLEITKKVQGNTYKYEISVDTHFVEEVEGLDLGEYESVQELAYYKSGLGNDMVKLALDYYLRQYIYDAASYESDVYGNGLRGYIKEKAGIEDGSVGEWATEQLKTALEENLPYETTFSLGAMAAMFGVTDDVTLSVGAVDTSTSPYSAEISLKYTVEDQGQETEITDTATLLLDAASLADVIEQALDIVQNELDNADFSNYADNDLQNEIGNYVAEILKSALATEVEDGVTAMEVINDAYQAHAHGSEVTGEGAEKYEKRLEWNEILKSEEFAKSIMDAALGKVSGIDSKTKYPILASIVNLKIAENGTFIDSTDPGRTFSPEFPEGSTSAMKSMSLLNNMLLPMFKQKTAADYINLVVTLQNLAGILPIDVLQYPGNALAEVQLGLVSDVNEPEDLTLTFEYIVEKEVPVTPDTKPVEPAKDNIPNTGDSSLPVAVMFIAAALIPGVVMSAKKQRRS